MAEQNYKGKEDTLINNFCSVFITVFIGLIAYLFISLINFSNSQKNIVNKQVQHIAKVDSLFSTMEKIILSNDSTTIVNSKSVLSQLQRDSALFKREILLAQQETNSLVNLHIEKIDNDYAQIGIWGGILSVIFIIFGFYGILKIEESKKNIEKVKEAATQILSEIEGKYEQLQSSLNSVKEEYAQKAENFYNKKTEEFNLRLQDYDKQFNLYLQQIPANTEHIKNLEYQSMITEMKKLKEELERLKDFFSE